MSKEGCQALFELLARAGAQISHGEPVTQLKDAALRG
jgi:hypothetical protein